MLTIEGRTSDHHYGRATLEAECWGELSTIKVSTPSSLTRILFASTFLPEMARLLREPRRDGAGDRVQTGRGECVIILESATGRYDGMVFFMADTRIGANSVYLTKIQALRAASYLHNATLTTNS